MTSEADDYVPLPSFDVIEAAATNKYADLAAENPGFSDFMTETSEDVALGFQEVMGAPFRHYRDRIQTGLYRIYMDFIDPNLPEDDNDIDMIHINSITAAFMFLKRVHQDDWEEITREFTLLAPSLELASMQVDVPQFSRQDARFAFLFAIALENGTLTGLRRKKD